VSDCPAKSNCSIGKSAMSYKEINHAMNQVHKNVEETKAQIDRVGKKIKADMMHAVMENEEQIGKVAEDTNTFVIKTLKDWGCNPKCIDHCAASTNENSSRCL